MYTGRENRRENYDTDRENWRKHCDPSRKIGEKIVTPAGKKRREHFCDTVREDDRGRQGKLVERQEKFEELSKNVN